MMAVADLDEMIKRRDEFNHDRFWSTMDAALSALARLGDIFWPTDAGKRLQTRGAALRDRFGIDGENTLQRKVRNSFEHVAERMDKWAARSENHVLVDRMIGNTIRISAGAEFARSYDPHTHMVSVFGEEIDLQPAFKDCTAIAAAVPNPSMPNAG
jgi:hypothetical protein